MWIGEQITKRGIGNGISILIFASILTSLPLGVSAWWNGGPMERIFFPLIAVRIVASVVFVQEGQRRIPIQYAKRMVGRRMTTGGATYLPLRVNMAGVIPVIFAAALLAFPATIAQYFPSTQQFVNDHFQPGNLTYLLTEAALIILFTYFYTAVQFNPVEQADNLRKYGGYIPGIRPGPPTAQYLDRVLTRLDPPGLAVPRRGRSRPEHLHQVRRLLAGELARPRRHVRADRGRRRARHDAPDGEPDDDAELRRLPQIGTVNVLVLGPQGSGKGTQAKRISAAHGVPHVSTGDMFRAAIADRDGARPPGRADPRFGRARPRRAHDRAHPRAALAATMRTAGFVLDGFPRNLVQAEALDEMLAEIGRPLDCVFFFDLDDADRDRARSSAAPTTRAARTTRPR